MFVMLYYILNKCVYVCIYVYTHTMLCYLAKYTTL